MGVWGAGRAQSKLKYFAYRLSQLSFDQALFTLGDWRNTQPIIAAET